MYVNQLNKKKKENNTSLRSVAHATDSIFKGWIENNNASANEENKTKFLFE